MKLVFANIKQMECGCTFYWKKNWKI